MDQSLTTLSALLQLASTVKGAFIGAYNYTALPSSPFSLSELFFLRSEFLLLFIVMYTCRSTCAFIPQDLCSISVLRRLWPCPEGF
jgi:hypothetical protein